jgi:predicted acylesterase/phospholipase RssA
VKGIGLAGAYAALSERGFEPKCVAGTSAGAITAFLEQWDFEAYIEEFRRGRPPARRRDLLLSS